jgi:hypothetical protein
MRRLYPVQEKGLLAVKKNNTTVTSTCWPVFPDGTFPGILAQGSGDAETTIQTPNPASTTRAVPQDQTSDQAEVVPKSDAQAATGAAVEAFNITVENFNEDGEDFVWTLTLTGFQKKQCIYIYENGTKVGWGTSLHSHTIVEPVAEQVVRAKASLFTKSPKEYSFW